MLQVRTVRPPTPPPTLLQATALRMSRLLQRCFAQAAEAERQREIQQRRIREEDELKAIASKVNSPLTLPPAPL
jgi:hypothetical protein